MQAFQLLLGEGVDEQLLQIPKKDPVAGENRHSCERINEKQWLQLSERAARHKQRYDVIRPDTSNDTMLFVFKLLFSRRTSS